jgi:hypothetical protein
MKDKKTNEYLINEVNKNEVAEELLYLHEEFLRSVSSFTICSTTKEAIECHLKILKMRRDLLYKIHKIF